MPGAALQHFCITIGFAWAAIPIGAPMGLAAEIVRSCDKITNKPGIMHVLGEKSTQLANPLREGCLEGMKLQEYADETIDVLRKVLKCTQKWKRRGAVVRWIRRTDMQKELEECDQQLDNAIKSSKLRGIIEVHKGMKDAHAEGNYQFETIRELFLKISEDNQQIQKLVQSHQAGSSEARELMKNGQQVLKEMRLVLPDQLEAPSVDGEKEPFKLSSSSTPNRQAAVQQYRAVQRGLAMLHRMTAILPPDKVLDGTARKLDDSPIVAGSVSDIWRGIWLEEVEVALKCLRKVKVDDRHAQRRLVREIEVWSKLSHDHILQFYGIVTDLGANIYMVSPWLENGDVLKYTKKHPGANRLNLIRGAAEGMKYLHSENIIHENLKCANILVTVSGEACVSDFGLSRMLEDVDLGRTSTSTHTVFGGSRWVAPEIIEGIEESKPSKRSDVYSFGMVILELLTGKPPFLEYRSGAAVIRAVMTGAQPKRPMDPNQWLNDGMWALMQRCWAREPDSRPTMEAVVGEIQEL